MPHEMGAVHQEGKRQSAIRPQRSAAKGDGATEMGTQKNRQVTEDLAVWVISVKISTARASAGDFSPQRDGTSTPGNTSNVKSPALSLHLNLTPMRFGYSRKSVDKQTG